MEARLREEYLINASSNIYSSRTVRSKLFHRCPSFLLRQCTLVFMFRIFLKFSLRNCRSIKNNSCGVGTVSFIRCKIGFLMIFFNVLSRFPLKFLMIYIEILFALLCFIDVLFGYNWFHNWMSNLTTILKVIPFKNLSVDW